MKSESYVNEKATFELFHNVRTSRYSIKCVSAESRETEKTKAKKKRIAIKSAGYWLEEGGKNDMKADFDRNIIQNTVSDPMHPMQQDVLNLEKEDIGVGEWFSYYFHLQSHSNYVSRTSPDGFVVLSIKKEKNLLNNTDLRRLLYRSSKVTIGILIPTSKLRSGIRRGSSLAVRIPFIVLSFLLSSFYYCYFPSSSSMRIIHSFYLQFGFIFAAIITQNQSFTENKAFYKM